MTTVNPLENAVPDCATGKSIGVVLTVPITELEPDAVGASVTTAVRATCAEVVLDEDAASSVGADSGAMMAALADAVGVMAPGAVRPAVDVVPSTAIMFSPTRVLTVAVALVAVVPEGVKVVVAVSGSSAVDTLLEAGLTSAAAVTGATADVVPDAAALISVAAVSVTLSAVAAAADGDS